MQDNYGSKQDAKLYTGAAGIADARVDTGAGIAEEAESAIKRRLGQVGRALKKIDVRKQIVDFPFAAVGIAAAAGAIVALVRPMPPRGRVSGLLITTLGAIGFRLVREAAIKEIGLAARNFLANRPDVAREPAFGEGEGVVDGGRIRYSPG